MSKSKVTNTVIRRTEVEDSEATYRYTLTVSESKRVASYRLPLYSIGIEMTTTGGKRTEVVAKDIFADVGKAVVFYDKIVENRATPLNLHYIIEDEMS